jgi:hypothetical protein
MRAYVFTVRVITALLASSVAACHSIPTSNLTGTWLIHAELDDGSSGNPTFVLKQRGGDLTGTCDCAGGRQEVTGSVTGTTALFGFHTPRPVRFHPSDFFLETLTVTYTGTLDTETTMSGTIEFSNGVKGKWTARK